MKSNYCYAGSVQLTPEVTELFKAFGDDSCDFYMKLRQELADAIPVSSNRISTNGKHKTDIVNSRERYLLSIDIEASKEESERSVVSVVEDLQELIKHKFITVISHGNYLKYLDKEYGYQPHRKNSFINYHMRICSRIVSKKTKWFIH